MGKAALVIMAAGIGSRFGGGIKQLEPVGPNGEIIMDYSIYDAIEAGFDKVVFVIRKDLDKDFRETVGNRIAEKVEVAYAYQEVDDIPEQYKEKFKERRKPWGTGQAILCCKDVVNEPFLVINADDYYGKEAYNKAYSCLVDAKFSSQELLDIGMIGFVLKNTLSENGGVTRGICEVNEGNILLKIDETKGIQKVIGGAEVIDGENRRKVDCESIVSMNMWAFPVSIFQVLEEQFLLFLETMNNKDINQEYLLPVIISNLLEKEKVKVNIFQTNDKWFGVTYKEDKKVVVAEINKLIDAGCYKSIIEK